MTTNKSSFRLNDNYNAANVLLMIWKIRRNVTYSRWLQLKFFLLLRVKLS